MNTCKPETFLDSIKCFSFPLLFIDEIYFLIEVVTKTMYSCSAVQSDEMLSDFSTNEFLEVEAETELSDSASSISTLDIRRKLARTFTTTEVKGSSDWELDYVKDVLKNAETMLKDLAT